MIMRGRYGATVHLDRDRVAIVRAPDAALILPPRTVSAAWSEVRGASVQQWGRLVFVAIEVRDRPSARKPFDDWAVPVESIDGAAALVTAVQLRVSRVPAHSSAS